MPGSIIRTMSVALAAACLALAATATQAASACKGLENAVCEGKADCSWVDGYTRKDGVKVSGHCRTKAGGTKKSSGPDKEAATEEKTG